MIMANHGKWIGTAAVFCIILFAVCSSYTYHVFQRNMTQNVSAIDSLDKKNASSLSLNTKKQLNISTSHQRHTQLNVVTAAELSSMKLSCNFVRTPTNPVFNVCIHNFSQDPVISKTLAVNGAWEEKYLHAFRVNTQTHCS